MAASLWWDDDETSQSTTQEHKKEDLLVFGYACKLFRDDEKAIAIDRGKLLIPWMGDEKLLIDRYDGRGHLFDLKRHDADNVDDTDAILSEEEQAVEKACDEERYLELHTDVREAEIYEEEEWKRYYLSLQEGYQAVGFGYDQQAAGDAAHWQAAVTTGQVKEEEEKPFVAPVELQVPQGMQIPSCQKQNARIEKTAKFIAQHGIQMEIMLKTKQSGNSQFDFLAFENPLNAYYKHMVSMIKSGKYRPSQGNEEEDTNAEESSGDNYLHPSLSSAPSLPPPPPPPNKPIELPKVAIHDTPYGALIKSIRKHTEQDAAKMKLEVEPVEAVPTLVSYSHPSVPNSMYLHPGHPPPPGTEPVTLPMVSSLDGQAFMHELYGPYPESSDRTISKEKRGGRSRDKKKKKRKSASSDSSSSSSSSDSSQSRSPASKKRKPSSPPKMHGPAPIMQPPPDMCPIVDRMAMYVAKNGAEFEMVVMNRKDARFQFLNEYHAFYPYYKLKKEAYIEEFAKAKEEDDKSGNGPRSISFSIKARPKEQESGQPAPKQKPKLFEYDSSEGEDNKEDRVIPDTLSETGSITPPPLPRAVVATDDDPQREMEEKLKDKLANAVKERLSQTNRERQLQQERKKKAAMFLNLIKGSQSSNPSPPPPDDSASLYVGEGSPSPVVYEYNNSQVPHVQEDRASSPRHKRRRRSPTPPSAYSLDRRPPQRPSPPRWGGRSGAWSSASVTSSNQRSRDYPAGRSRSPHRKEEKRKKHRKHSKSRSPQHRTDKSKDRLSKHSREKSKHKSKDRDKDHDRHKKSKHRSRERETSVGSSSIPGSKWTSNTDSDVEILNRSPISTAFQRVDKARLESTSTALDLGSIPVPSMSPHCSASTESYGKGISLVNQSDKSSVSNSPSIHNHGSRGSTPGISADGTSVPTSMDLMSKVRAMLKKSRELARTEDKVTLDESDAVL